MNAPTEAINVADARSLSWSIKASFVSYVNGMQDGACAVTAPGEADADGWVFPGRFPSSNEWAAPLELGQFRGAVNFSGHHGLLHVVVADPWVNLTSTPKLVSIADPDWPGRRMELATFEVERLSNCPTEPGTGWRGVNVRLTADGADLFFRVYEPGDFLDDFTVHGSPAPTP
ncbi:HtaA domain-containing protein [Rhodococcoides fascians]|uniref:HtaA domain-containing protein n=1 Tax=Rhodococcoides fascians TaxID=1828 RepID=UPI00056AA2E2|nr:HtaA domain-containing protein [Rhodococcus fascians]